MPAPSNRPLRNFPVIERSPHVVCSTCTASTPIPRPVPLEYFGGSRVACKCGAPIEWHEWFASALSRDDVSLGDAFAPVGAMTIAFPVTANPGEWLDIDLTEFGFPLSAQLLSVEFFPMGRTGNLYPFDVAKYFPAHARDGQHRKYFPVPIAAGVPSMTHLSARVSWVPQEWGSPPVDVLVEAYRAFIDGRFDVAVLFSNVSVEMLTREVLAASLERTTVGKKRVDDFFGDASYGHQLNVVLPALAARSGVPPMPKWLLDGLNRLKRHRNDLAHRGHKAVLLAKDEAARLLSVATMALHYLMGSRDKLTAAGAPPGGAEP